MKIIKPIIEKHKFKDLKCGDVFGFPNSPYMLHMKIAPIYDQDSGEYINTISLTSGGVGSLPSATEIVPQPNAIITFSSDEGD